MHAYSQESHHSFFDGMCDRPLKTFAFCAIDLDYDASLPPGSADILKPRLRGFMPASCDSLQIHRVDPLQKTPLAISGDRPDALSGGDLRGHSDPPI
ncbi:hypothetical protein [Pseudomonas fluorescens]|uniref:hypothetical protein n=1 Tax=Pseudomonas TaxID=286 RepID=UPI003D04014C